MKKTTTPSVRKETKRQQIKDYEAATPEVTQPNKIIFFEKDNTTHRRTFCFLVRKEMKNPAKLLPKNAHCLGQKEKIPDLVLYHQTTILTNLKKFFDPGQCLAFLA